MSLVALMASLCAVLLLISLITAVCGVLACRRKRAPPPTGPAHWSTHVTVTPNCRCVKYRYRRSCFLAYVPAACCVRLL